MHVCPVDAIIHSSVCLVFVDLSIFMIISRDVLSVVFCYSELVFMLTGYVH